MTTLVKRIIKILVIVAFIFLAPAVVYFTTQSQGVHGLISTIQQYRGAFLVLLLVAKSVSIIYPPLPGAILTLGAIPVVGWQWAYTIDILGSTTGATIAYFLGQKYGEPILRWAISEKFTNKLTSIKVKEEGQFWTAFMLRIASGGMLSDGLAWGASLIKLRYPPFIVGYLSSHLLTTLPVFYLLSLSISVKSWIYLLPAALVAIILIYKFKGKYFE